MGCVVRARDTNQTPCRPSPTPPQAHFPCWLYACVVLTILSSISYVSQVATTVGNLLAALRRLVENHRKKISAAVSVTAAVVAYANLKRVAPLLNAFQRALMEASNKQAMVSMMRSGSLSRCHSSAVAAAGQVGVAHQGSLCLNPRQGATEWHPSTPPSPSHTRCWYIHVHCRSVSG